MTRPDPMAFDRHGVSRGRIEYRDRVQSFRVDAAALAARLEREIGGEVRFDDGTRALYATDASNYRQVPIGVVLPKTKEEVVAAVAAARAFGAPLLARGGGTSLAGQCCNVAVVLDLSKYLSGILEIDPERRFARVLPGLVLDDLRDAAEEHGLTFGPDPATHSHCTLGGMIGNNSCGIHSVMAGRTSENIEELEVLTYDGARFRVGPTSDAELETILRQGGRRGEIYAALLKLRDRHADAIRKRFPAIPRRGSGYSLDELLPEKGFHVARALCGSESTCALVLEATVRLVPSPPSRVLVVLGYPDVYSAADHAAEILEFGPIGLEGMDDRLIEDLRRKGLHVENLRFLPEGDGWLLVEFGGDTPGEAGAKAQAMVDALHRRRDPPAAKVYAEPDEAARLWEIRESGLGATANVPGQPITWEGWEDSAVPPPRLGDYLRDLRRLLDEFHYGGDLYGHFGDGCVHTRINFDLQSAAGIATFRRFVERAADLVVSYGGSLSGEHGDGQSRGELLERMYGPELVEAFREFKRIWDPDGKMNPGKVVEPYRLDENLRLGPSYAPWTPATHFRFPDDEGSFARATLRCVGVGKCRRLDDGIMCPSFMATREEEHSTRGRAHLLFEMFQGEAIPADWNNDAVKEALDLCLACKGCKTECPVNVDVATYKAEFLAHYYEHHLRPRSAWTMGLIWWWARAASVVPPLANAVSRIPPLSWLAKIAAGVSLRRTLPRFAGTTLRMRLRRRPRRKDGPRVLLWPDTFTNYFHPAIGEAAVDVLERAGYRVDIPRRPLCCGRPLYDFGFLGKAKQLLRDILGELREVIDAGIPIVGLEPSCVSVFRDELLNLFPDDASARRLSESVMTLGELLDRDRDRFAFRSLQRAALVQAHCHQATVIKMDAEERVLRSLGLEAEILDSGCCGMAGAFGFEAEHYEISRRCAERVLFPAVRQAPPETLIIANGFSCREQIVQGTGRVPLHLAEVARMAF